MARRSAKIAEIKGLLGGLEAIKIESLDIQPLIDLRMEFDNIGDKRFEPFIEHLLSDIVMISASTF